MRKPTHRIYYKDLCQAVSGVLYRMAPGNSPRKIETIMCKLKHEFERHEHSYRDYEMLVTVTSIDLVKFIHGLLFKIPEFTELNLSQREYYEGVSVNDENRPQYMFTDAFSNVKEEDDFVDLDAAIRNIANELVRIQDDDMDCFLCVHQNLVSDDESTLKPGELCDVVFCSKCKLNGNLINNYQCRREPKGKYTIACKNDCVSGWYICCDECTMRDTCQYACDSDPETCGNIASRK